jgi:hypothetical protein
MLSVVQLGFDKPYYQYMYGVYVQDLRRYEIIRDPKPVPKDQFISSVVEVLQEIKQISVTIHNITITSAIISRPEWMGNEGGDMIDEACLLAGIEVFEQPSGCIDMAAKIVEPYDHILVLQLTHFSLDIHRRQMSANAAEGSSSVRLDHLSAYMLHRLLAERVIQAFNNANISDETVAWTKGSARLKDVNAAYKANWKLKNAQFWDKQLDFESRMVDVNLTDASGELKEFSLSGKEVMDVEQEFFAMVRDSIETFLWDHLAIFKYREGELVL